jgi:hypothetical protein
MPTRTLLVAASLALSLSACLHDSGPAAVDQDTALAYNGYAAGWTDCWQSFTAGRTGSLAAVRIWAQLPSGVTLTVYEGEGTSGRALATTTALVDRGGDLWEAALPGLISRAGEKYTVRLSAAADLNWIVGTYDYADGVSNVYGALGDFAVTTYVR